MLGKAIAVASVLFVVIAAGCLIGGEVEEMETNWTRLRLDSLPEGAAKALPEDDSFPPVLHGDEWDQPVPIGGMVNTVGGEDSPFILPDGQTLYFFFTPDVRVPAELQILDGVTGIWRCSREGEGWGDVDRVVLCDDVSLDGCAFILNDTMWFCSARAGNEREIDFYIADLVEGRWQNPRRAGDEINGREIGELHISKDGREIYFGSSMPGGLGGRDLWACRVADEGWSDPVGLGPTVNSELDEDQPFLTEDGREIWFTGTSRLGYPGPAIFRSVRQWDGSWGDPVEVISRFAGEPCLDAEGNIYFVHHFYNREGEMIEADIYVARRRDR